MAIKVISSQEPIDKQKELHYPVLMQDVAEGILVVLFTTPRDGTVMIGDESWAFGESGRSWTPATDSAEWKKFEGTISLSNQ